MAAQNKEARTKALETALGQIDRQFGKGSAMRLGMRRRSVLQLFLLDLLLSMLH